MDNLITLKIKATSFNRLINELKSLKDIYLDFSNNTDDLSAGYYIGQEVEKKADIISSLELYKK